MVIFTCPHCQAKLGLADEQAGKNIDCPQCQAKSTVPAQEPAAAPVDKVGILSAKTQLASLPTPPPEAHIKTQLAPPTSTPDAQLPPTPERLKKTQLAPPPFPSAAPPERPQTPPYPMLLWIGVASGLVVLSICILAAAVGVVLWNRNEGEPIAKGKTDGTGNAAPGKEEKGKITQPKAGDIITNAIGMKLAYVPPGKFLMGSPPEELDRERADIGSEFQHEVTLTNGFFMGAHAVTQEEYQAVMGENPSTFSAQGDGKEKVAGMDTRRFPVETVSWDEATEFCRVLSQKEGKTYRLPTEAEWEHACRAGTATPFHFGKTISTLQANYDGSSVYGYGVKRKSDERPLPVGSFQPNDWGLYDMHGNVWQWCEDWYRASYYENSPKSNPVNEKKGQDRVVRGGAWNYPPSNCRSACRYGFTPGIRLNYVGFRVVSSPP